MDAAARERRIVETIFNFVFFRGLSEAGAKTRVCEAFGIDTRRVEQIWQPHRLTRETVAVIREWQEKRKNLAALEEAGTCDPAYLAFWDEVWKFRGRRLPSETK